MAAGGFSIESLSKHGRPNFPCQRVCLLAWYQLCASEFEAGSHCSTQLTDRHVLIQLTDRHALILLDVHHRIR